jgi:D-tyrosyl-tRNA(Tyr) deacylase
MRALVQRVSSARVKVADEIVGEIGRGLLVFVGISKDDTASDGDWIIKKLLSMRLFEDENGKMGRGIEDICGGLLVVSQFTLYGDLGKGARPDFGASMPGEPARIFYNTWVEQLKNATPLKVEQGRFAASMAVELVNDGPVTLLIDSNA